MVDSRIVMRHPNGFEECPIRSDEGAEDTV